MVYMRQLLLAIGTLGAALCGLAFCVSLFKPLLVEQAAREIVRMEIERRVHIKLDALSNSTIASLASKALGKTDQEIAAERQALAQEVPQKVARVIAQMLNPDCACRKRLEQKSAEVTNKRIQSLSDARARLVSLIETAYSSVANNLLREFQIFMGSNALAFAALALVTYFRRKAALQLLLPAVVLLGAMGLTGGLYLFNQNWLHTIIYGQYVGLAYIAYLGLAIAFLADVIFNRARLTTQLINIALQVVGSAVKAIPC